MVCWDGGRNVAHGSQALAWERRGKNRKYFYVALKIEGRVVKKYLGKSMTARLAASALALRREVRQQTLEKLTELTAQFDNLLAVTEEFQRFVADRMQQRVLELGYRNPGSRGWRKIRR